MRKTPIFVTYYTDETYRILADSLCESLKRFGLPFESHAVIDVHDWFQNCLLKPIFIYRCLRDHGTRPVVFLDADMLVESFPTLLVKGKSRGGILVPYWLDKVIGGPVRLSNTMPVRELVLRWSEKVRDPENDKVSEMTVLGRILGGQTDVRWGKLPPSYYWIPEMFINTEHAKLENSVVIRHWAVNRSKWSPMKG